MAGPAASDVPDRYDVVFSLNDGTTYGFLYADSVESNLPFRTHKALYSYSPTFLERQNLSNTYGDNFQDFFLTASQADFSEGEQQKFFRVNDQDSVRKYWAGTNIEPVAIPGQVFLAYTPTTVAVGASISSGTCSPLLPGSFYTADATNVYKIDSSGTVTTIGAHGLGATPSRWGMCSDGTYIYLSSSAVGIIRKMTDGGTTFSTFSSAHGVSSVVVNNNILYGYVAGSLYSFDTSGTATEQFGWKDATGVHIDVTTKLVAYGGSLMILRSTGTTTSPELWTYDGSGCRLLASLPADFVASDLTVSQGIAYISGVSQAKTGNTSGTYKPAIYYYSNGSVGKLWESQYLSSSSIPPTLIPWGNGLIFNDSAKGSILVYDIGLGGVHSIFQQNTYTNPMMIGGQNNLLLFDQNTANATVYPASSHNYSSTGTIQTSQYDFDNTLSKVFRGIKVDADLPANTSVDIAYQLDGAGGTYTNLQTGATSGTEYLLPANTTGHSISVRITLNSATGSATPTLKHVYVRAAPTLQQFRKREYLFDLSGGAREDLGKSSRRTRDMTAYPKDPITACNDLVKIATQTIPFTVYDRFTTAGMTVIADLQQNQAGYDGFAIYEVRPNVFIGRINLREV